MPNPDIRMTEPMEILKDSLSEPYSEVQEYLMSNYSEVDNELDPQLAWLVRNIAYARGLIVKQQQQIDALRLAVGIIMDDIYEPAPVGDNDGE